jgi:hypothetical protein
LLAALRRQWASRGAIWLLFVVMFVQPVQAMGKKCKGSLLVTSDVADMYVQYKNNVKAFIPLKIQVDNRLYD